MARSGPAEAEMVGWIGLGIFNLGLFALLFRAIRTMAAAERMGEMPDRMQLTAQVALDSASLIGMDALLGTFGEQALSLFGTPPSHGAALLTTFALTWAALRTSGRIPGIVRALRYPGVAKGREAEPVREPRAGDRSHGSRRPPLTPEQARRAAIHEAGHALMFAAGDIVPESLIVEIRPGAVSGPLGRVSWTHGEAPSSCSDLEWLMWVALAGISAEEVVLGDFSLGREGDLDTWLEWGRQYLRSGLGDVFVQGTIALLHTSALLACARLACVHCNLRSPRTNRPTV